MDYAVLTDNKGRKADCRHVVLIMTSDAEHNLPPSVHRLRRSGHRRRSHAENSQKNLKPEFINRLSATVVFHDMDRPMASLILDRNQNWAANCPGQVEMVLSQEAHEWLLQRGFIPNSAPGDRPRDSRPLETLADARNSVRYIEGRRKSPRASGKQSIQTTTRNRITIWSFN